MIIFFAYFLLFNGLFLLGGFLISAPRYSGPVSDHFNGRKFTNPGDIKAKGLKDVFAWMFSRTRGPWPIDENFIIGGKPAERIIQGVTITFVNHSTFLLQFDGLNILTDPIWSKRTSPFEWAGPKRKRPPGIKFEDLPKIDFVLLSHNHWDHLDIKTIRRLREIHHPKFVTPLGVGIFLQKNGIKTFPDLDWWDEVELTSDLKVQAVPAQHFSGRGTFDRDATLWVGYVLKRSAGNIYFAGDSGYNNRTFKEIGIRCAPIAISLIPIGAYKPGWFMSPIHCSPEQAVTIHQDLKSAQSIATHFGTFQLADDGRDEPTDDLKSALVNAGERSDSFIALNEGIPAVF